MMKIDSVVNLYSESIAVVGRNGDEFIDQKVNFEDLINDEVRKNTSIEEFLKNVETNYNAKITVSSDLFFANQITGLNNVIIGGDTLNKMKNDSVFCEKILKVIDEVCSYSAQQEVRSLTPPVKSAGVIIYPDGSYLCWLESIYSDGEEVEKDSDKSDFVNEVIKIAKEDLDNNTIEQFNNWTL